MKGFLNNKQIEYVFDHLFQSIELDNKFKKHFSFQKNDIQTAKSGVVFQMSSDQFIEEKVTWINSIPILYPLNNKNEFYSFENGCLIFHHDLLKSAFYLLSGYQEIDSEDLDSFGRFKFECSAQKKLGIVHKPIVNYYFKIIVDALCEYAKMHKLNFKKKQLFNNFGFFLTHDIDNVDYYNFNRFLYKIKELSGLSKTYYSTKSNFKQLLKISFELLKFSKKQNPVWNFNYLINLEKKYGFRSAFYFLSKDKKHHDSRYKFNEKRIQSLFNLVKNNDCEIGIHGTVGTVEDLFKLKEIISDLRTNSFIQELGIRQHRLLYRLPKTTLVHEQAGIVYDTTVSFAEHEGFRNSYCLPFRYYDFENDRPIDVWEIPLNVMDVTLFHYRKLNNKEAFNAVSSIIGEVIKFNGVFTLLWHNDFFDEVRFPGVGKFYENLLERISQLNPECMLGHEIVNRVS